MAKLTSMNREELNAEAARLGVANADSLEKNADVIAAIEASDAYKAEQEAAKRAEAEAEVADQRAASDEPKQPVYIVNGRRVDPNGKPVGK